MELLFLIEAGGRIRGFAVNKPAGPLSPPGAVAADSRAAPSMFDAMKFDAFAFAD